MAMFAAAIIIEADGETVRARGPQRILLHARAQHFIATLIGFGTLFFVYRGSSDTEDALLTLAGVAALIAALVPQGRPELCTHPLCQRASKPK